MKRPDLANTFKVSKNGAKGFYEGEILTRL